MRREAARGQGVSTLADDQETLGVMEADKSLSDRRFAFENTLTSQRGAHGPISVGPHAPFAPIYY